MRRLQDAKVQGRQILVRIDTDCLDEETGKIADESRLKAAVPTLKYLFEHGAIQVFTLGHAGKPGGKQDPKLSLKPVQEWFAQRFLDETRKGKLVVLENTRFDPREESNNPSLVEEWAALVGGENGIFVFDAMATAHREHASTTGLIEHFGIRSYAGLRVQKEVEVLDKLRKSPKRPFLVIVGGKKEDKVPVIKGLISLADEILVGGKVANELQGKEKPANVTLPMDGVPELLGFDIGPRTITDYKEAISKAKTIFWAGPLGKFEDKKYEEGTKKIAEAVANSDAYTVVGGGDTAEALTKFDLYDKINFVSVGGGAALLFVAGKKLPALEALE